MASAAFRTKFPALKHINWFPGHMATAKNQIQLQLANIDVILEVRDARMPFSSANPILDEICQKKPRLVVFNKADLANNNMRQRISSKLQRDSIDSLFTAATKGKNVSKVIEWCTSHSRSQFKTTGGTVCMIVGIPNVGKSSMINEFRKLASTKKIASGRPMAVVGPTPGVTRRTDMIKVNHRPAMFVIDTPGVMIPKLDNAEVGMKLALIGAIKDEIIGVELLSEYMLFLLNQFHTKKYVDVLKLKNPTDDIDELYAAVLKQSKGVGKDPESKRLLAAQYLLEQFREGAFGQYCLDDLS